MHAIRSLSRLLVPAVLVAAWAGPAAAQTESDLHFQSDTVNRARVDDRGGTTDGYSFEIGYDDADSNSENFCPHCRFNLMVADLGLTLADLERMGVEREDLNTLEGLVSTLAHLTSTSPAELAAEAEPGFVGPDLDALTAWIEATIAEWTDPTTALANLAAIVAGTYSFDSTPLDDLLPTLGIQFDSAFAYNFADPNDLRRLNTGVEVYTAAEYVNAVTAAGASEEVLGTINTALAGLPFPGQFEISGDDDDANAPATFHARYTNLTVKQRTYVINDASAYLVVYTIVNDTDRVLPFVEAAMIADFDIPPQSSDKETLFEPLTSAVMVYDEMPYEEPVQHWYFGLAPMTPPAPMPYDFVLANFNLDDQLSLSQSNATSQENRQRFMLWHPDFIGDRDTAEGKTEKQGAVSVRLPVPLLPGDERAVGFCYAGSMDTSKTTALAETTALLQACRVIFATVIPNCGDGRVQIGEECDYAISSGCTTSCTVTVCGDGVLEVGEECDDNNTVSEDGCSASCIVERCGDLTLQPGLGEECDDGNSSNADACLNDCRMARCGDGFLRTCDPATEQCGCAGYDHCLQGSFTLTSGDGTGTFGAMLRHEIDYLIGFDLVSTTVAGMLEWQYVTGPIHAEFSGDTYASEQLAAGLAGAVWDFSLRGTERIDRLLTGDPMQNPRSPLTVGHSLDIEVALGRNVTWRFDARFEYPLLDTVQFTNAAFTVRRARTVLPAPVYETLTGTGDGRITSSAAATTGEACDDGNGSDFDECTNTCLAARCGDGITQPVRGEQCDDGATTSTCTAECRFVDATCGNNTVEAGEECDDPAPPEDGDGCSALCLTERCGDGVVQEGRGEECDDGANGANDGCTDTCIAEVCGDGILQGPLGEECDNGATNADTAACTTACRNALCGDGLVQAGVETCDDGNGVTGDGCTADCVVEVCGDLLPGPGEECDDGNTADGDGCTAACVREFCGDAVLQTALGEQCDDGNAAAGDGCSRDCQMENLAACGNRRLDTGEQCDDGNNTAGDGCSPFCQLENPDLCGNRRVDAGEGCDDGNNTSGDGCSASCTAEACGDGIQQLGERCDDGNNAAGDGCAPDCTVEDAVCGNEVQDLGEQCDDGNTADGDGCDAACQVEDPTTIDLRTTCGNGARDRGEQCDDGNRDDGDGCDETCQVEPAVCGNGRLERGEACDDGNNAAGDACPPRCAPAACGDGFVDPGETCDDGNTTSGDGCSATCQPDTTPPADDGCSCGVTGAGGGSLLSLLVLGCVALLRRRPRRR